MRHYPPRGAYEAFRFFKLTPAIPLGFVQTSGWSIRPLSCHSLCAGDAFLPPFARKATTQITDTLAQCWCNAGLPSAMLGQHYSTQVFYLPNSNVIFDLFIMTVSQKYQPFPTHGTHISAKTGHNTGAINSGPPAGPNYVNLSLIGIRKPRTWHSFEGQVWVTSLLFCRTQQLQNWFWPWERGWPNLGKRSACGPRLIGCN